MNPFEKITNLEIYPDAFDGTYHVNFVETVPVRNGYSFERRKFVVERGKLEKIVEEIIHIVKTSDSSSIGRASGFQPEC